MPTLFIKTTLISVLCLFTNHSFGQKIEIVAGQIADMKVYNFQKTTIMGDIDTHILMDSVDIVGAPVYDLKIRSISNGVADTWLSYQILQSSPSYPWKKMEIAVQPFNQFSANVARFEQNESILDISSVYQWEKLESFTMFISKIEHQNDTTKRTAGVWTDTLPHFMAFRYFGQNYLDTLYGYLKISVKTDFLISQTSVFQLAIQSPVLATKNPDNELLKLKIFPNPVGDFLQIRGLQRVKTAQIIGSNGQILWSSARLDLTNFSLDTAHFPTGNYWFQFFDNAQFRQIPFKVVH